MGVGKFFTLLELKYLQFVIINRSGVPNNDLHVLVLTSITNADCRARLPEFSPVIYDHTLCVLAAPGNSICSEGNPLVANGQIHGVSSWDALCDGTTPSMHERVFHFRSWIESVIS